MRPISLIAAALAAMSPTIASACDYASSYCSNPEQLTSDDGWRSMIVEVDLGQGVRWYPFISTPAQPT
jgi:hypothetical protein